MSEPSGQRRLAPVFYVLAGIIIALGIAQAVRDFSRLWPAVIADFVIAGVLIALGRRVQRPPDSSQPPRPLRAPRPPK